MRLRPLALSDAPAWRELKERNRSWLSRWEATVPPGDTSGRITFRQMVRRLRTEALAGRMLPFAIDYAEPPDPADVLDGLPGAEHEPGGRRGRRPAKPVAHRLVGQLTVSSITWGSLRSANIGYWVDETVAGRGITPTALALAVDHCFRAAGLHRIEVCIRPENAASLRVVHKLGFRPEGLRRAYLHIDGDWRDHEAFALTAQEVPDGLLARWRVTLSSSGTTPAG
ncbi:GNAT family N-acetyltransferase [Catenulispora pinisilvae]|uniref:GNAT family N-acetyltransferase n=1 Tax=Catenulispora pinisilvae TaxID=2705253 RepID=UPI002B26B521|nr:GNAT family protein [Catenulispora pinisilvae]